MTQEVQSCPPTRIASETSSSKPSNSPPDQRPGFLAEACRGDADLLAEVGRLLLANADPDSILEPSSATLADAAAPTPTAIADGVPSPEAGAETLDLGDPEASTATGSAAPAPPVADAPASKGIGTVVAGRYELVEVIGEGGMGSVYRASQSEPVKRQVALKLIRAGMDSRGVLARFDAERQALALMDHPNIARIYDGGMTQSGQPFFVMELVEGVPITDYCDRKRLPVRARLELFVAVCQAVQHAHQKGIIHRDLKPANVLVAEVDGRPTPKVIDFGVAKATEVKLTDMSFADTGAIVGTPTYMSPEQADPSSMDIDTRTDVYALGIMLYELLTGSPPIDASQFRRGALLEMLRMVREVDPPRPSTRLSTADALPSIAANRSIEPARLSKLLQGELDWVVMKALEKDRARRYDTANGFARDIQRYLADEVVEARPPSRGYRLKKFVKRNKVQVVAASLVLLTLVGGIIGTSVGLVRADRARDAEAAQRRIAVEQKKKAEKARDRTREVLDAMTAEAIGDSIGTQKEITPDQKKFLSEVLTYYKEFAGEKADDEQTRARTAEAASRVGMIEYRLGARPEAKAAFEMGRDAFRALAADFPAVASYREDLASNLRNLGFHLRALGRRTEAEAAFREALALQAKLADDFPRAHELRRSQAVSQQNMGSLLMDLGRLAEAERVLREALAINQGLADHPDASPFDRDQVAASHANLANVFRLEGKVEEAEAQFRQAQALSERLVAEFPEAPDYRHNLAVTHANLGTFLNSLGRGAEAREHLVSATNLGDKLAADFPAQPIHRYHLASARNNLGTALNSAARRAEAEEQYRKALALREKLAAEFPTEPDYRQQVAASQFNLGCHLADLGRLVEAAEFHRKAMAIQEKLVADSPGSSDARVLLGKIDSNYGATLGLMGRYKESLPWLDKAIALIEPIYRADPRVADAKQALASGYGIRGKAHEMLRKCAEAANDWERAVELMSGPGRVSTRANLATMYAASGSIEKAVAIVEAVAGSPGLVPEHLYNFACVYGIASGKIAGKKQEYEQKAMKWLQAAVEAGYDDLANIKKDTDLAPLRDRDDFRKLLADMEAKAGKK